MAAIERQRSFLAGIDGRLPFATPRIEAIDPGGAWTIERRLPGTSLLVMLRTLGGNERLEALRSHAEAVDAIATITFPERTYGEILDNAAIMAATWRDYVRRRLDRFVASNGRAISAAGGDLESLRAKALALLEGVAAEPPKALVHGDYFPGNVLIDEGFRVSGLVDFSVWTVVGDPLYDVIGAAIFMEMAIEATADDIAFVRRVIRDRHGDAVLAPARFYRAYFAFAMADPRNAGGPYPSLWPWALSNLGALGKDRIGF